jgi:hypothetical protein
MLSSPSLAGEGIVELPFVRYCIEYYYVKLVGRDYSYASITMLATAYPYLFVLCLLIFNLVNYFGLILM